MPPHVTVNARFMVHRTTGMQRYAREVVDRLTCEARLVRPNRELAGIRGHAWEQIVLPIRASGDVLWSPCNTGPVVERRQVVTIHDIAPLEHPEWFAPTFVTLYRLVIGRLVRLVPIVLAVSEFTKDRLVERFDLPEDKIRVTGEGAAEWFQPPPTESVDAVAATRGLVVGEYFLFVGNLTPRKNLPHLVRAFGLARRRLGRAVRLVLAGAPTATKAFPAQDFATAGDVDVLDFVPDAELPSLMAGSLAVVVPSHYEGFGLPALEAMACGAPVIAARASALPEVVGEAGLLTEPDDDEALAEALVRMASDSGLRAKLAAAGLERAYTFTWEQAARVTDDALLDASDYRH